MKGDMAKALPLALLAAILSSSCETITLSCASPRTGSAAAFLRMHACRVLRERQQGMVRVGREIHSHQHTGKATERIFVKSSLSSLPVVCLHARVLRQRGGLSSSEIDTDSPSNFWPEADSTAAVEPTGRGVEGEGPGRGLEEGGVAGELFEEMKTEEDLDARVNAEEGDGRPTRVGWAPWGENEESIRVVPAEEGCMLGSDGKGWHWGLAEWYACSPASWMPPRRSALPPVSVRVPGDVPTLHRALKSMAPGRTAEVKRGVYKWDGAIKIRKGVNGDGDEAASEGVHVTAERSSEAWGRWLLGKFGGGTLAGLQCKGNHTDVDSALMDVRHGPWHFTSVGVQCVGGQAVLGMEWCELRADECVIGGFGEDSVHMALGGVMLLGRSNVLLKQCVVQHTGDAQQLAGASTEQAALGSMCLGVMCAQDAHCHVVECKVSDNDVGAGVRDCGTLVVAGSSFTYNRDAALYAQDHDEDESDEEEEVLQASAHRQHAQNGSAMILVGSWTNSRTWYHHGRPSSLNNYLYEGWRVALRPPHVPFPARSEEAMKLLVEADPSLFPDPYSHRYAYEHPRAFRRDGSRRNDWFLQCYNCGDMGHWGAACPYGQKPLLERKFNMVDPEWANYTGEIEYLENIDCRVPKPKRTEADLVAEWNRNRSKTLDSDEEAEQDKINQAVAGDLAPHPLGGRIRWSDLLLCYEWAPQLPDGGLGPWQVAPHPILGLERGGKPEDVGDGSAEGFSAYLTPENIRRRNNIRVQQGLEPLPASHWPGEIVRLWNLYNPTKPFRPTTDVT